jgi:hypothetical protein
MGTAAIATDRGVTHPAETDPATTDAVAVDAAVDRRLLAAGVLFAVGSAVHTLDHLRRGQGSITDGVYWAGNLGLVLQVVVVTLIFTRHRLAPAAAVAAGFPLALGFLAVHWLPGWDALRDPLGEIDSWPWVSYAASLLEIAGALAVGFAGLAAFRRWGVQRPAG